MAESTGRMPVLASLADAGRNIGGAWAYGANMGGNIADKNYRGLIPKAPHLGSVGGLATFGGLGMAGAVAGAAIGSQMGGQPMAAGAMIGGAAGLAALPALGLASSAALPLAKGVAGLAMKAPGAAGGAALGIANIGARALSGINMAGKTGIATNAALMTAPVVASAAAGFAKSLINWDVDAKNLSGVKLSKIGVGVVAAGAAFEGVKKGFQEMNKIHMGQNDGMVTKATPSYMNNAGATGDLVFAMNANRKG